MKLSSTGTPLLRHWVLLTVLLSSPAAEHNGVVHAFAPPTARTIMRPASATATAVPKTCTNAVRSMPYYQQKSSDNESIRDENDSSSSSLSSSDTSSSNNVSNGPIATADELVTSVTDTFQSVCDLVRDGVRNLARLSLEDYKWRSSIFKANEADRKVEESLARMLGEEASYVRPMDATETKIGPLGRAEKLAVGWLSQVIEEEGRRAERIVNSDNGEVLVRPIEVTKEGEAGPLAFLERQAVEFFASIRESEKARVDKGVLRPKDLDETKRGPLGEAEFKAVSALSEIQQAEKLRMQQQKLRGGEVVRPIDVPGPLGEVERKIMEVMDAEKWRKKDRENNNGRLVRPKDATVQGPLGEAETKAMGAVERLQEEERERLRNIQRVMKENQPMALDRLSPLGILEAIVVGIIRAPQLIIQVVQRVMELLSSEKLQAEDEKIVQQQEEFRLRLPTFDDEKDDSQPFS